MEDEVKELFEKVKSFNVRYQEIDKELRDVADPLHRKKHKVIDTRNEVLAELFKKHYIDKVIWVPTTRHFFTLSSREDEEIMDEFSKLCTLDYHDQVILDGEYKVYFRTDDGEVSLKFDSYERVGQYAKDYGMKIDFKPLEKDVEKLDEEKEALQDIIDKIKAGSSWYDNGK